jgi:hypothetical protein
MVVQSEIIAGYTIKRRKEITARSDRIVNLSDTILKTDL